MSPRFCRSRLSILLLIFFSTLTHSSTQLEVGDWIEYSVDVEESGEYSVEYRLASLNGSSGFELLADGQQVDVQTVPSTEGWQNWVSEISTVSLDAGEQTIRINAIEALWNLIWLKFTKN